MAHLLDAKTLEDAQQLINEQESDCAEIMLGIKPYLSPRTYRSSAAFKIAKQKTESSVKKGSRLDNRLRKVNDSIENFYQMVTDAVRGLFKKINERQAIIVVMNERAKLTADQKDLEEKKAIFDRTLEKGRQYFADQKADIAKRKRKISSDDDEDEYSTKSVNLMSPQSMARDGDSLEQIARDRAEIKRKREEEEAVYERKMGRMEKTKHHKSTPDSSTTRLKETKNDESLSESKHKKRKHRHNSKEQTPLEAPIDAKEAHNPSPIDSKDAKEAHNPSIDSKDAKEAHNPSIDSKDAKEAHNPSPIDSKDAKEAPSQVPPNPSSIDSKDEKNNAKISEAEEKGERKLIGDDNLSEETEPEEENNEGVEETEDSSQSKDDGGSNTSFVENIYGAGRVVGKAMRAFAPYVGPGIAIYKAASNNRACTSSKPPSCE